MQQGELTMTQTQITLILIFTPLFLSFFIVSIFMLNGKGSMLISGYNTLSKEEKAKYKEKELTQFIGKILMFNSLLLIIFVIGLCLDWYWIIGIYIALVFSSCIYAIIKSNGKQFKKDGTK